MYVIQFSVGVTLSTGVLWKLTQVPFPTPAEGQGSLQGHMFPGGLQFQGQYWFQALVFSEQLDSLTSHFLQCLSLLLPHDVESRLFGCLYSRVF